MVYRPPISDARLAEAEELLQWGRTLQEHRLMDIDEWKASRLRDDADTSSAALEGTAPGSD